MLEIKQLPIYTELVSLDSSALHLSNERFLYHKFSNYVFTKHKSS